MERSGSPMLLFANLDLRPLHSILWKDLHFEGAGRPVEYDPECDLRALLLRQLEQIPSVKDLVKRLNRSRGMRSACRYTRASPDTIEGLFGEFRDQAFEMGIIDRDEAVKISLDSTWIVCIPGAKFIY